MSALDDDMFYYCGEATTAATDVSQEEDKVVADDGKHIIQFDYDLLVSSSTKKPIKSILVEFEKLLLQRVGSNVCSNTTHQEGRNVMLRHRRRRLVGEDAASSLKELSSLPNDEVVEDMKCSTKTTSTSDINIACHPINGYMTSSTSTLFDDDIERQILNTIKSSMDFYVENENPFDSVDIVGVNYVGVRDSSLEESNLVDNNTNAMNAATTSSSSALSKGELAGVIIGCILGILFSAIITIRWYNKHSKKKKKKGGTQATDDENDEGLDEYNRGNKSGRGAVEVGDELSIIPPVSYPEPPTAAFSNTTGYNQDILNTREDDETWLAHIMTTETYETEATQKVSNTTTPHWQRQYYTSHQETIDERDDEEESYY
jgi:hypothetical protein